MSEYGLKEYKELLEKAVEEYNNPLHCPFTMDPNSVEAKAFRRNRQEALVYALEMLPEIPNE